MNTRLSPLNPWQVKALAATKGSRFGAILHACFGVPMPEGEPSFGPNASITSDGYVMCNYTARDGQFHHGAFVGSAFDLCGNVNGLAQHLDFTAEEKESLYTSIRGWITQDYRSLNDRLKFPRSA